MRVTVNQETGAQDIVVRPVGNTRDSVHPTRMWRVGDVPDRNQVSNRSPHAHVEGWGIEYG